jgi:hypothetical protein
MLRLVLGVLFEIFTSIFVFFHCLGISVMTCFGQRTMKRGVCVCVCVCVCVSVCVTSKTAFKRNSILFLFFLAIIQIKTVPSFCILEKNFLIILNSLTLYVG